MDKYIMSKELQDKKIIVIDSKRIEKTYLNDY